MSRNLDNATVLITGGTGSLGQTLVRRLLRGDLGAPRKIIVFSRCEAKQYAMKTTWKHAWTATDEIYYDNFTELIEFWIGDVRDPNSIEDAMRSVDVVFHAAAMKQVPTCEYFPAQAVATNVRGAENVVRAARRSDSVHTVVGVSTDKACKPINVMGMTKALQERIVIEGNLPGGGPRMLAVRYGNVLSSRGSVIPLFKSQIANGGPVTITLPEMTRFLLSLDSAVDTIFAAYREAQPGEIFVPRVPSARIPDIAAALIDGRDIATVVTGIRPGEKLHEILVSEEEAYRTVERADHYVVQAPLPELQSEDAVQALEGEYSSRDAVVHGAELEALIAQSGFVDPAMGAMAATGSMEPPRT
ncbi:MAG: polysaccharide biosynthesis protein [Thermoleophilaceae bacterium]